MHCVTQKEAESLAECEALIERGMKTFVQVGEALAAIRDARLYRESHDSFESYCRERWGWSKQHAYRLIECAPMAKSNPQVTSINQARELSKVAPERRQEVIERATEATGGKLTAKAITEAAQLPAEVLEIADEAEPEPPKLKKYVPSDGESFYLKAWVEMEKITKEDTQRVMALTKMIQYCEERLTRKK